MKKIILLTIFGILMSACSGLELRPEEVSDTPTASAQAQGVRWTNVPTQFVTSGDVKFAYRELGVDKSGVPVIFLVHLGAVLDNWDPRVVDGFAAKHHVVALDYRGVGASSGDPADSMEQMAMDVITFIKAKGFQKVDLFGFSMGGMIAQEIVMMEPQLIRKMIIAGTGPAGGEGISDVSSVTYYDMFRGYTTFQDPKQFLFFTRTPEGIRAGKEFLERIKLRKENRDKEISLKAFFTQLKAIKNWGKKEPQDLSKVLIPTLVANGDDDRMVPTKNTYDLAKRLPKSELIIYPDAGHGGVFQYHAEFVPKALEFLAR
jgi:pimeloyl-ACP methyl ester carboxylesterase